MDTERVSWESYAQCYDTLTSLRPYQRMVSEVADTVRSCAHDRILDAGCGTGTLIQLLAATLPHANISGVDASPEMLARARSKCASAHLLNADLTARLPFDDTSFDVVTMVNVLYALPDPTRTLAEVVRVLRRTGTVVISTPRAGFEAGCILKEHSGSDLPDAWWAHAHQSAERERALIVKAVTDVAAQDRLITLAEHNRRIVRDQSFTFYTADALHALVVAAGLTVREHRSTYANQNHLLVAQKE